MTTNDTTPALLAMRDRCVRLALSDESDVPTADLAGAVTAPATLDAAAPTLRPPADQRCERCDRVLIAAPCPCVTPVERYLRAAAERDAAWRALSRVERIEAIRRRAA